MAADFLFCCLVWSLKTEQVPRRKRIGHTFCALFICVLKVIPAYFCKRDTKVKLHECFGFLISVVTALILSYVLWDIVPVLYTTKSTNMAAALATEFRAIATPPRPACILSRLEAGRGSAVRTWAAGCMTASSTNRDEQDRTKRHRSCDRKRIACLTTLCRRHKTCSSHWMN